MRHFVAQGANVVFCDMNDEQGKALEKELGATAAYISCNVVDEKSVLAALSGGLKRFGQINGVLNCAGTWTWTRV